LLLGLSNVNARSQQSSDVTLDDSSDWWSLINYSIEIQDAMVQNREINKTNYRILNIDVRKYSFEEIEKRLGNSTTVERGDAGSAREQVCYMSSTTVKPAYLIFEQGEVSSSFYLFSEDRSWNGRNLCVQSKQTTNNIKTESGLHLGQSMDRVIGILGKPGKREQNEIIYVIESKVKTSREEIDKARLQNPELSDKEIHDAYDIYNFTVVIRAKFDRSGMIYLAVVTTETT
jgi:hypothetical protein